ncbi:hypothetical protein PSTG_14075 [Puccinia striiformis f. sp. tritici PST-78]|uniref:Nudix hydrolase domain-containing protein n=1 Tax=Puccinia striiformis f. sp. tritici PST-78 TaxID=1165861 RepID=A0A0L0UZW1_9BASI|nr:hypothetical protein PSTG_14075 [Puccinia striiformis f. sp. tritici PST-78]
MAAAADCSPKNDYVKAAPTFQLQSATIISSQPLKTSAAKWIGPRLIDWVDETGMEHKWEVRLVNHQATNQMVTVVIFTLVCRPKLPLSTLIVLQFRPPVNKIVVELPAGLIDEGESAESAALRELHEETGYGKGPHGGIAKVEEISKILVVSRQSPPPKYIVFACNLGPRKKIQDEIIQKSDFAKTFCPPFLPSDFSNTQKYLLAIWFNPSSQSSPPPPDALTTTTTDQSEQIVTVITIHHGHIELKIEHSTTPERYKAETPPSEHVQGHSFDSIHTTLVKQISPQSFNQWKALYKETRHVIQEPEEYEIQGQPDLLTQDDKDFMTELIAAEPGLFLDEIREQVYDHSGTLVSPEAIQHCLTKKLGMTLKKAKVSNIRKNLIHKYDFIEKMEPIPAEFLVFTDKSSVCSRVLLRTNGATATLRLAKQCCSLAILGLLC